ncbi:hypothetical protein J5N97_022020 [Dioscorea zingiberensis]|uniref:Trimethylguanosine synthase n=1 Tax=Dioscorea zingiberensis TaxID=325984 RepID=A0A9D5CAD9_9LILI|nr:hypothetical protein J5N97_022020 [Dioscorea zingiberensis]
MTDTEIGDEAHTITALGSLFKITDVYLWDDAVVDTSIPSEGFADQYINSCSNADTKSSTAPTKKEYASIEDIELAREIDALGLPLAFSTTKEKRNLTTRGKRHEARACAKSLSAYKDIENRVPMPLGDDESKDVNLTRVFHDRTNSNECVLSKEGEKEVICFGLEGEHVRAVGCSDGELTSVATVISDEFERQHVFVDATDMIVNNNIYKELTLDGVELGKNTETLNRHLSVGIDDCCEMILGDAVLGLHHDMESYNKVNENGCSEVSSIVNNGTSVETDGFDPKSSETCHASLSFDLDDYTDQACPNNSVCFEFGDWKVAWDTFYMRYYFYNCQTQESTWFPPEGLDCTLISGSTSNSNERIASAVEDDINLEGTSSCRTAKLQESLYDTEDLVHSSAEVLFNLNDSCVTSLFDDNQVAANYGANLDKATKKFCEKQVTSHFADIKHSAKDELDVSRYLDKEENDTCEKFKDVHDILIQFPINNSPKDENGKTYSLETCTYVTDGETHHQSVTMKKKKKLRRRQSLLTAEGVVGNLSANIVKYWCQRYLLFSQFDSGIKMDEEGWFSVTPESIARHHASRCGTGTVVDCFAGVGGNSIQFAMKSNHVIAIDIDSQRIDFAQHNAAIYGVRDKIDFINADFFQMAHRLKGDSVFLSPPWGGPEYTKVQKYNVETMLKPHNGSFLFNIATQMAPKVIMFLPRNVDLNQLVELALSATPPWALEVERNFLNGKLKAITAYFESTGQ